MAQYGSRREASISGCATCKVEVGVFDFSRLPIRWDHVELEKVQQAVHVIEESLEEQVEQLTMAAEKSTAVVDTGDAGHTEEAAPRVPSNRSISQ
jgi:hypothetical protein